MHRLPDRTIRYVLVFAVSGALQSAFIDLIRDELANRRMHAASDIEEDAAIGGMVGCLSIIHSGMSDQAVRDERLE